MNRSSARFQKRLARKRYLNSKRLYEYERILLHIPKKFHEAIKPYLEEDLDLKVAVQKDVLVATLSLLKTLRHAVLSSPRRIFLPVKNRRMIPSLAPIGLMAELLRRKLIGEKQVRQRKQPTFFETRLLSPELLFGFLRHHETSSMPNARAMLRSRIPLRPKLLHIRKMVSWQTISNQLHRILACGLHT